MAGPPARYTAAVRLLLALLSLLSDATLRRLGRILFMRTDKELNEASASPERAQLKRLLGIVERNAATRFGRAHGFAHIKSVDDYRRRVPLSTWDDVADDVEAMIAGAADVRVAGAVPFYATTSGTTGRRKLIPVPDAYRDECRVTNRLLYRTTLLEMPGFIRGKRLSMRSPGTEALASTAGGPKAGSITVALSGAVAGEEGVFDAVPAAVYEVKDFASRYYLCLRFALQEKITMASAINPSTLLLFARTLEEHGEALAAAAAAGTLAPEGHPLAISDEQRRALASKARRAPSAADRVRRSIEAHGQARMIDAFPDLVGLACWKGGSAPWYLTRLKRSYGELPTLDYGYAASEGCFGAPLSTEGAASVLMPHGHFFELIPEDDVDAVRAGDKTTKLLHELRVGERYFVVITTSAGLYRYEMNDLIEVVGHHRRAPLVVFRHKGGAMASLTGEKLGEAHVVQAMDRAHGDSEVAGFAVAPLLPPGDDESPAYLLAVDAEPAPDDAALVALADAFDRALCEVNEEYEAKRKSLRLAPAKACRLPPGAIGRMRAQRVAGGAPDAHVKIPHLSADGRLLSDLGLRETAPELEARLVHRVNA